MCPKAKSAKACCKTSFAWCICQSNANLKLENQIWKSISRKHDSLKPHFYIVKLGFTGVYVIFLISAQKHRLWVLV